MIELNRADAISHSHLMTQHIKRNNSNDTLYHLVLVKEITMKKRETVTTLGMTCQKTPVHQACHLLLAR